jgi:hypothetical protein
VSAEPLARLKRLQNYKGKALHSKLISAQDPVVSS